MISSIRWRIGLFVFLLVATFQVGVSLYALHRVRDAQWQTVDDDLFEELFELQGMLESGMVEDYVRAETASNTKWDEDFFEVLGPAGERIVASTNVPPGGLELPPDAEPLEPRRNTHREQRARVGEIVHPASRKGHVRVRVAQMTANGYRLTTAESMKAYQKSYWALRQQLGWSLLVVSIFSALGAWWAARRSLAPIQAVADEARRLGASPAGSLPRTGTGDELDRLTLVLNEMLERIRLEVQRVRRLTADAAHALRTPMTTIRGTLELQLRTLPRQQADELVPALEVLDETMDLVNGLLLLERLESQGSSSMPATVVELDALVRQVCEAVAIVAHDRDIDLKCAAEPARVRGDAAQLRNAILNVLDNALRHTPGGGRVEARVERMGDRAQVCVEDTGPGLRPDQIERVFERFYSEREDGVRGGLGLPIARAIAQAHGGSLTASSPRGARFVLDLPSV